MLYFTQEKISQGEGLWSLVWKKMDKAVNLEKAKILMVISSIGWSETIFMLVSAARFSPES